MSDQDASLVVAELDAFSAQLAACRGDNGAAWQFARGALATIRAAPAPEALPALREAVRALATMKQDSDYAPLDRAFEEAVRLLLRQLGA